MMASGFDPGPNGTRVPEEDHERLASLGTVQERS